MPAFTLGLQHVCLVLLTLISRSLHGVLYCFSNSCKACFPVHNWTRASSGISSPCLPNWQLYIFMFSVHVMHWVERLLQNVPRRDNWLLANLVRTEVQFSFRWYPCGWTSLYAFHPISQECTQCCFEKSSAVVWLTVTFSCPFTKDCWVLPFWCLSPGGQW